MNTSNPLAPLPIYPGTTPRFHAMVKPVGAICNLDCTYCYYLHKEQLLGSNANSASAMTFSKPTFASTSKLSGATKWCFRGRAASRRCWVSSSLRR